MPAPNIKRRDFLKGAAVLGALAALGNVSSTQALAEESVNFAINESEDTKVIRTACRGCGKFECGVLVTVTNGKAVKIEGDPSYPGSMGNCCAKSQASLQAAYHPARLTYPMIRTNPKGEDPGWQRISWDEAIETACKKFDEIQEKYGGASLAFFGGTSRIYAMSGMSAMAYLYDSPNAVSPGQVCKGPRNSVTSATSEAEFAFVENIWRPNVFVQWGSGIEVSNYDDAGRTAIDNSQLADCYINIDARMSNLAKEAACREGSYFLNVRPGTDAAIALAWTKLAIDEELYDDWYVRRWTNLSFLVCKEMEPSGVEDEEYQSVGLVGTVTAKRTFKTVLLKESDVDPTQLPWEVDGEGDPHRFIVWDAANERFTYLDSSTGLWEGEEDFTPKYVPGSEWYIQQAQYDSKTGKKEDISLWDKFSWEPAQGSMVHSQRKGLSGQFLPDPDSMPILDGNELPTTPALYSADMPEIRLKDGSPANVQTAFECYYDNVKDFTADYAEEITGVEAQLITDSFHAYARRYDPASGSFNGGLNYSVTHEHTGNAMKLIHTMEALDAIMGNIDTPGGHRGITNVPSINLDQTTRILGQFLRVGDKNAVTDMEQRARAVTNASYQTGDATAVFDAMLTGNPMPFYGGLTQAGGILNQTNISEAYEAIGKLDFFVDANLWRDPISSLADLLLPEQHWLEIPGCTRVAQGSAGYYGAHIHCIEAPGEARYGIDWVADWYKQKDVPFWTTREEGEDPWEMGDFLRNKAVQSTGMSWEEYAQKFTEDGWFDARANHPNGFGCCRRFQTGWMVKPFQGRPGFNTNTSRHEIWVTDFETKMRTSIEQCTGEEYGTKYALPFYTEPKSSPDGGGGYVEVQGKNPDNPNADKIRDYTIENYPYIMSTGRRIPVYFHSEHRQLPWCREVWPVPRLEVSPKDALELQLEHGDWAWIETPFGKIRQCVDINASVGEGRMSAEHSWWFPELDQPGYGFDLCGCNCLVDSHSQCEGKGAPQLRGYLARVYKATPENSPFNNPVPCGNDGTEIITSAEDPRLQDWAPVYEGRE